MIWGPAGWSWSVYWSPPPSWGWAGGWRACCGSWPSPENIKCSHHDWWVLMIISTCSSIWSRFCLEFLRFSLDAAVDILNCLRASSSCDMGRVWEVVAELGSLRPTETSYKHLQSVTTSSKLTPSVARHKLGFVDVISSISAKGANIIYVWLSSFERKDHQQKKISKLKLKNWEKKTLMYLVMEAWLL